MKSLKSDTSPAKRVMLAVEVNYRKTYGRQELKGKLINISLSGAFLKTGDLDFGLSEKIHLTFSVGTRKRDLAAKIVWKNEYGMGVEFFHTNNRDVQIVDDLIYYIEESRQDRKQVLSQIFEKVS
ncbi:MAG: PilZ domain-containing protein [Bdellovibrionales bacterium]|nr:PilZ domain-containing protein [Bdellovibrionales bacterium]